MKNQKLKSNAKEIHVSQLVISGEFHHMDYILV